MRWSSTSAPPKSTSRAPRSGPIATTAWPAPPSPYAPTKPAPRSSTSSPPTTTTPATSPSPETTAQTLTKRYTTPFGAARGTTSGIWPDDKTFLGKPTDTGTGLTHIGAREYDPTLGQFISVDPLLSPDQPQSLNGYGYANSNPVTTSDPSGLRTDDGPSDPNRDLCYINVCNSGDGIDPGKGGAGNGNGSGTAAAAAAPVGRYGDKTTTHDLAQARAIAEIQKQARKLGVILQIETNMHIAGASKVCMYPGKNPGADCSYGKPDILGYDAKHGVWYVWEVKSVGQWNIAVREAQWYVSRMRSLGMKAVLGWTIGGPYRVANGYVVIGPQEGAVIYGKPGNRKWSRVPTTNPMGAAPLATAQPVPQPSAAPGPGAYPGTTYQPGLGTIPQASNGGFDPILVPMIVMGAGVLVAGGVAVGEGGAAAATITGVAATQQLFGLAA
ncbi:RHS repeat-associated core domain-containing protein [Streptomyces sp. NPDC059885]|uniref:RHS repeat-associated core domain-containing protein n=1 Tax=Streptomyces sp. NPDC059885 TaxID=3346988 RepID=UPI003656C461